MPVLHIINKSPFQMDSLDSCLRLAKPGAGILLIEDAIYAAQKNTGISEKISNSTAKHKIYALAPDMAARGIEEDNTIDQISLVDYEGFVQLVTQYSGVQSWL
jgi:tRNA 2-thiouridine synthesizing protein B